jgi:hypothetical protein
VLHSTFSFIVVSLYLVTHDLQAAEGFLESDYVTKVAKWALGLAENSVLSYGFPCALYALIMAGVRTTFFFTHYINRDATLQLERGFCSFKTTGTQVTPSRFTKKEWNSAVCEYMQNMKRIAREDWAVIMKAAKGKRTATMTAADNDPDTSILQQFRSQIYIPKPQSTA